MTQRGVHHVTAIAGAARGNLDFYRGVLGQRLVKRTVNFDDPGTHHLYFGDARGAPGTITTFFPWAKEAPGAGGAGEVGEIAYRIPTGSADWWRARLAAHGVAVDVATPRFGAETLAFRDPDGLRLALFEADAAAGTGWPEGGVPADRAIGGIDAVTLTLADPAPTAALLTNVLGFAVAGVERDRTRLRVADPSSQGMPGSAVDLVRVGTAPSRLGRGSVHHVAFRCADDATQSAMADRLRRAHGIAATERKDRCYFRSIYFREPGGVLFEIATDAPGFAVDEAEDRLGERLMLPPFLEARRASIERVLPPLG